MWNTLQYSLHGSLEDGRCRRNSKRNCKTVVLPSPFRNPSVRCSANIIVPHRSPKDARMKLYVSHLHISTSRQLWCISSLPPSPTSGHTTLGYILSLPHLQHVLGSLGSCIIDCTSLEVILVLLAVHPIMDGFTQDRVLFIAHLTVEFIYIIVIETEPRAVWCPAMEGVVTSSILGYSKNTIVPIIQFLWS